jgi:hypothetical protein
VILGHAAIAPRSTGGTAGGLRRTILRTNELKALHYKTQIYLRYDQVARLASATASSAPAGAYDTGYGRFSPNFTRPSHQHATVVAMPDVSLESVSGSLSSWKQPRRRCVPEDG